MPDNNYEMKIVFAGDSIIKVISEVIGLAKKESFYGNETTLDIKSSWLGQI